MLTIGPKAVLWIYSLSLKQSPWQLFLRKLEVHFSRVTRKISLYKKAVNTAAFDHRGALGICFNLGLGRQGPQGACSSGSWHGRIIGQFLQLAASLIPRSSKLSFSRGAAQSWKGKPDQTVEHWKLCGNLNLKIIIRGWIVWMVYFNPFDREVKWLFTHLKNMICPGILSLGCRKVNCFQSHVSKQRSWKPCSPH